MSDETVVTAADEVIHFLLVLLTTEVPEEDMNREPLWHIKILLLQGQSLKDIVLANDGNEPFSLNGAELYMSISTQNKEGPIVLISGEHVRQHIHFLAKAMTKLAHHY